MVFTFLNPSSHLRDIGITALKCNQSSNSTIEVHSVIHIIATFAQYVVLVGIVEEVLVIEYVCSAVGDYMYTPSLAYAITLVLPSTFCETTAPKSLN